LRRIRTARKRIKGWACDLVPKSLIVDCYFAPEQEEIRQLEGELESALAAIDELEEENGGEEDVFASFDKINKPIVTVRLRELRAVYTADSEESRQEAEVLEAWLELNDCAGELKKKIQTADKELDQKAYEQYPKLGIVEIKSLVVDDKWLKVLEANLSTEINSTSQSLTQRIMVLTERYEKTLSEINKSVSDLDEKVRRHLERIKL
jgi:type I restriction enzyme M protein